MSHLTETIYETMSEIRRITDRLRLDLMRQTTTIRASDIQEDDIIIFRERHVVQVTKIELDLVTLTWFLEDKVETFEWELLRPMLERSYLVERKGIGQRLVI